MWKRERERKKVKEKKKCCRTTLFASGKIVGCICFLLYLAPSIFVFVSVLCVTVDTNVLSKIIPYLPTSDSHIWQHFVRIQTNTIKHNNQLVHSFSLSLTYTQVRFASELPHEAGVVSEGERLLRSLKNCNVNKRLVPSYEKNEQLTPSKRSRE